MIWDRFVFLFLLSYTARHQTPTPTLYYGKRQKCGVGRWGLVRSLFIGPSFACFWLLSSLFFVLLLFLLRSSFLLRLHSSFEHYIS
mmetsp:Transcript_13093/g.17520  ORF Transcript_13093/g.17520 Transcript_13093/m.17520 type:complete len:86 (-) Transcript_13093:56-313(-)